MADIQKKIHMPKWLIQGIAYGTVLGGVLYTVGQIAVGAFPDLFAATYDVQLGAIGFIASVAIAYSNDITQQGE